MFFLLQSQCINKKLYWKKRLYLVCHCNKAWNTGITTYVLSIEKRQRLYIRMRQLSTLIHIRKERYAWLTAQCKNKKPHCIISTNKIPMIAMHRFGLLFHSHRLSKKPSPIPNSVGCDILSDQDSKVDSALNEIIINLFCKMSVQNCCNWAVWPAQGGIWH